MTGTSYWKLKDNALQHHAYITSIISDSLQTSHNPNNFNLHHYDLVKNKMRDRLQSLCIFLHRQVIHEERFLIAEISRRTIHSSHTQVNLNLEQFTDEDCLVACDFSKAFHKLDRTYLFALLQQIGLHSSTLGLTRTMYHHTDAFLDINGSLSPIINMKNGLRQGCPLSALLFLLGIEPFLFHLQHISSIQSSSPFKIIAYADDITCCLKNNSLQHLF